MYKDQKEMVLEALEAAGTCTVLVHGTSMWPFIRDGDKVVLTRQDRLPGFGDVVGFFEQDQLVVHRVRGKEKPADGKWMVTVQGDAMSGSRARVAHERIIGFVDCVIRNGREKRVWVRRPLNRLAGIVGGLIRVGLRVRREFRA
jgi:hypothetical protein